MTGGWGTMTKTMRAGLGLGAMLAAALALTACKANVNAGPEPQLSPEQHAALVEKGRYLAAAGDCAACHTREGGEEFAGGRALDTPFGKIYAPNITSDQKTGIGAWTRADFRRALHHGQGKNGENLYPAFSYPYYARVTAEDADAIYAYMRTVPAVSYDAPKNELGFPFNIRLLLKGWNLLHFRGGEYKPDKSKSAEWNRGAYLVEGLGHCGACHTPKNIIGGDRNYRRLQGGVLEGWYASDLTGNKITGLGNWSEQDIVDFLKTGINTHSSAYGGMAEVVRLSTSKLTDEDLKAMAVYLKSIPDAGNRQVSISPSADVMEKGKALYAVHCPACHLPEGEGVPMTFPALAGNPNLNAHDPSSVIQIILKGTNQPENPSPGGIGMTAFPQLTNAEVAALATYVRNSWGNKAPPVTASEVGRMRHMINKHNPVAGTK
jgi:mono/diheme cytochrome c family protein